ncbi:MAG TPA: hypothetical protein VFU22_34050 [Roseiflexaceae bacterium]|nr:hypothetical protein [Roseiflexaceae bacterium]
MEIGETLDVRTPEDLAHWLAAYGQAAKEIWVIIYKKGSGKQTVTYEQLVETALCYGWIDGVMKGMDAERYAQRFSPRRKRSNWTASNKAIAQRLLAEGRMTEAGRAVLPSDIV